MQAQLRDLILSRFEINTANSLVEYAKYIATTRVDYIIFMARKASRLHDLLVLAGCPGPKHDPLYHHVLDQDLARFRDKRILLVDDTLILGTTLGEAERKLRRAGAKSVASVVFAVDRDHWSKALVKPTRIFKRMDHQGILSFCTAEVSALAAFGMPYLSDFPICTIEITSAQLSRMHSLNDWSLFTLTSVEQAKTGIALYTALPQSRESATETVFGRGIAKLVDICKVRCFLRRTDGVYSCTLVPIATAHPLEFEAISTLFDSILATAGSAVGGPFLLLRKHLQSPINKLRLCQYALSLAVGYNFLSDLVQTNAAKQNTTFSLVEAIRVFGPWVRSDIELLYAAIDVLANEAFRVRARVEAPKAAPLPAEVVRVSEEECYAIFRDKPVRVARTLKTDLESAFLELHKRHELPARNEVKRLGAKIFQASKTAAPHRDRLKYGFAWSTLSKIILEREGVTATPARSALLSLVLDNLIDVGIAVPILSSRNGVVFRAYRHGENVPFANQEAALAHDMASGFMDEANLESIPRLAFEKLLVALLKVGTTNGFMQVVHGLGGEPGVVRIGYHLHGAVTMFPRDFGSFADDQSSWLSTHLVEKGVFTGGGRYGLGKRPEAATINPGAPKDAEQLGRLFGLLWAGRKSDGSAVLRADDLIAITTCMRPNETCLALAAELTLSLRSHFSPKLTSSNAPVLYKHLVRSQAYTAVNSARLKINAYHSGRGALAIQQCGAYLRSLPSGKFLETHWLSCWGPILRADIIEERRRFERLISSITAEIWHVAIGLFTIELAIASADPAVTDQKRKRIAQKALSFLSSTNVKTRQPEQVPQLIARLETVAQTGSPISKFELAYGFGLRWISERIGISSILTQQALDEARSFGRIDLRTNFDYVLWYDIIDSLGQKSGLEGDNLRLYRDRVREFKERIANRLTSLTISGSKRGANLHVCRGSIPSKDDEKHIFFSGRNSLVHLRDVAHIILGDARSSSVSIRLAALNTDFSGPPAHKFSTGTDVEGEAFWERFSRVKRELKTLEQALGETCTVVWLLEKAAERGAEYLSDVRFRAPVAHGSVQSVIENYPLNTRYVGGPID